MRMEPGKVRPALGKRHAGQVWLHRYAVLCAAATFPLIFVGGLVTGFEAALAVPDWPTTYGYNMFSFPLAKMVGGIFYEHGHRLLGSGVGILTVGLTIWLGLAEPRKWLRMLGILALGVVVAQGILGGLRVTQLAHWLAIPHACLAQMFFCLMAAIALFTSPRWQSPTERITQSDSASLPRVCLAATLAIYFQLVAGAVQRHTESLIGIPLWVHLGGAVAVIVLAVRATRYVLIGFKHRSELANPARIGLALLGIQLLLGAASLGVRWVSGDDPQPAVSTVAVTTAHVAIGALLLMTYLILTLQSYRLVRLPTPRNEPSTIAKGAVA